jgi:hypothetical protein
VEYSINDVGGESGTFIYPVESGLVETWACAGEGGIIVLELKE